MRRNTAKISLGLGLGLAAVSSARADDTGLTSITTSIATQAALVVIALGAVALTALSVASVIWGGKAVWRFFKGLAK
ncbi:MAG: hypothetical protein WA817_12130 [Candidatus Acidiferrum sp.]